MPARRRQPRTRPCLREPFCGHGRAVPARTYPSFMLTKGVASILIEGVALHLPAALETSRDASRLGTLARRGRPAGRCRGEAPCRLGHLPRHRRCQPMASTTAGTKRSGPACRISPSRVSPGAGRTHNAWTGLVTRSTGPSLPTAPRSLDDAWAGAARWSWSTAGLTTATLPGGAVHRGIDRLTCHLPSTHTRLTDHNVASQGCHQLDRGTTRRGLNWRHRAWGFGPHSSSRSTRLPGGGGRCHEARGSAGGAVAAG